MAQVITNQANLSFQYNGQTGTAASNIATAVLSEAVDVTKTSLDTGYRAGEELTFVISFTNNGSAALTNVTVTDNLGEFTPDGGASSVVPLTFSAPALLFINGDPSGTITPATGGDGVTFTIPTLAAGANGLIVYRAVVNSFAPLEEGGEITNTASVTADGINIPVTDSNTVTVEDYADVVITKAMSPSNVADGGAITYSFTIYNYGNTEATDIVLTDDFDPAPENISVYVNGVLVPADDYTYTGGVLTLPTGGDYTLSLPAAAIIRDETTGEVTVEPSTLDITVTGTI